VQNFNNKYVLIPWSKWCEKKQTSESDITSTVQLVNVIHASVKHSARSSTKPDKPLTVHIQNVFTCTCIY